MRQATHDKYGIDPMYYRLDKAVDTMALLRQDPVAVLKIAAGLAKPLWKSHVSDEEFTITWHHVASFDGYKISVHLIEPKGLPQKAPCLLYFHGGGFMAPAVEYHKRLMHEYAQKTPCKVLYVDYRLAPQYRFPFGFNDCYATLEWVSKNVDALQIDPAKIALGGESAGAALVASVAQKARDINVPKVCFQMLCCPVTDSCQTTESIKKFDETPVWNSKLNALMWQLYLPKNPKENLAYASPMHAKSFTNLPATYLETAEFDPLHDEGKNYANALTNAEVPVEYYETKGTVHAYDILANTKATKTSMARRIAALKKAFFNV
jgi:acetyl esterase/lipase